jgi:hypothetical protein
MQLRAVVLAFLLIGIAVGGVAGYAVAGLRSNVTVLTGTFYAGDRVATAEVDGWDYGLNDGVRWLDSMNTWHEDGWPDCLSPIGTTHTVRFAWAPVDVLSVSWRQIVWVSCLR